jgi:hypothetical protein
MAMTLDEYLAVPYILVMESVERPDGEWVRRASYPELPGCQVEAFSPIDAIDQLEDLRRQRIEEMIERGEHVPVPRPPLRHVPSAAERDRLDFARWLVDSGRISDK